MLAAHALGLGTCPVGLAWKLLGEPDVKQELHIPAEYTAIMPIIVGFPGRLTPAPARMDPQILCWQ